MINYNAPLQCVKVRSTHILSFFSFKLIFVQRSGYNNLHHCDFFFSFEITRFAHTQDFLCSKIYKENACTSGFGASLILHFCQAANTINRAMVPHEPFICSQEPWWYLPLTYCTKAETQGLAGCLLILKTCWMCNKPYALWHYHNTQRFPFSSCHIRHSDVRYYTGHLPV